MNLFYKIVFINILLTYMAFGQTRQIITVSGSGYKPDVAVDQAGNAHIVWDELIPKSNYNDKFTYYSLFDKNGNQVIPPLRISNLSSASDSKIILGARENLIVWGYNPRPGPVTFFLSYIMGQFIDKNGNKLKDNFYINDGSPGDIVRSFPSGCAASDTTFMIMWKANGPGTPINGTALYGQTVSKDSIIGNNFITDNYTSKVKHLGPIVLRNKEMKKYAAVWIDDNSGSYQIYSQIFNLNGTALGNKVQVSDDASLAELFYYSAAMDSTGRFAVVWSGSKNNKWQINRRWFSSDGIPMGAEVRITADSNNVAGYACVDISINKNGNSVVAWEEMSNNKSKIFLQRFRADGSPLGQSINCSQEPDSVNNIYPSVALTNDNIYLCWQQSPMYTLSDIALRIMDFNNPLTNIEQESAKNMISDSFILYPNYPNPFNPGTKISFQVNKASHVELSIYNTLGEKIRTLEDKDAAAGSYSSVWDGRDLSGKQVSSGIYFFRLTGEGYSKTNKMLLVR